MKPPPFHTLMHLVGMNPLPIAIANAFRKKWKTASLVVLVY